MEKVFKDDDPGTYDPVTKRHARQHIMVNVENGDITIIGKTPPENFIPVGWIKVSDNRYVPTWPSCRYRRLSVQLHRHNAPDINAVCLHKDMTSNLQGTPVDHSICVACPLFEATLRAPILTEEEKQQLFKREYRNDLSESPQDGVVHVEQDEDYWDGVEDAVFREDMSKVAPDDPHHPKNARKIHIKWNIPCIHRYEKQESDCGGCSGIMCNNPAALTFEKKITRSDCKSCTVAEPPKRL